MHFKGEDCEKADAPLASNLQHKLNKSVSDDDDDGDNHVENDDDHDNHEDSNVLTSSINSRGRWVVRSKVYN